MEVVAVGWCYGADGCCGRDGGGGGDDDDDDDADDDYSHDDLRDGMAPLSLRYRPTETVAAAQGEEEEEEEEDEDNLFYPSPPPPRRRHPLLAFLCPSLRLQREIKAATGQDAFWLPFAWSFFVKVRVFWSRAIEAYTRTSIV